jgi:hypothetical protein
LAERANGQGRFVSTLDYIAQKFGVDVTRKPPIQIENINRQIMAETLAELGYTIGAEIGVAQGYHAEMLCKANPNLKLYGIDAWQGYPGYLDFRGSRLAQFYEEAKERLAPYRCELVRKFSMDAVKDWADSTLDFVYIDGAHDFKNVALDICEWSKKVRPGGIVYGHDFKRPTGNYINHVPDVVPAYCYAHGIRPWFVLGTRGHSDGMFREGQLCWAFVVKE